MKKIIFYAILVIGIIFCSIQAKSINIKNIEKTAVNWANSKKNIDISNMNIFPVKATSSVLIYGINFPNESGWLLLSGDDKVKPILGYSTKGTLPLDLEKKLNNDKSSSFLSWLNGYAKDIDKIIKNSTENSKYVLKTKQEWQTIISGKIKNRFKTAVEPLINSTWSQRDPYNKYCPKDGEDKSVVGCVATAMAMIIRYHEYPLHGIGSHTYNWNGGNSGNEQNLTVDFSAQTYNWKEALTTGLTGNIYNHHSIAKISSHCGASVDMNYSSTASGAYTREVANALKQYFGYSSTTTFTGRYSDDAEWINLLKEELDNARPMEYSGYGDAGGHAFILDGYNSDGLFHFNWGWEAAYNGYFEISNLNPGPYTFNESQGVIYGIKPPEHTILEAPILTSLTRNDDEVLLNWEEVSETPNSYKIYRNDVLINEVNNTELNDMLELTEPYYAYFVTAVYNNGESKPSQTLIYDNSSPELLEVNGRYSLVNKDIKIKCKILDISSIESTTGNYIINGTTGSINFSSTDEEYMYEGTIPAQNISSTGNINFVIIDSEGIQTTSPNYEIGWGEEITLNDSFENLDALDWNFDGNANWKITGSTNKYAVSGNIDNGQNSIINLNVIIPDSGKITFDYKVSSEENYDKLYFYINGKRKGEWSGDIDWANFSVDLSAGEYLLSWEYHKDQMSIDFDDNACIDNLSIEGVYSLPLGINEDDLLTKSIELITNYPNPFNPTTNIKFLLNQNSKVSMNIFNIKGEIVEHIFNNKSLVQGMHIIKFSGNKFASGIYYCKISANGESIKRKMILIK